MEVLLTVKDSPHFQSDNFWYRMMEKIVKYRMQLTCKDIIEITELYTQGPNKGTKRAQMAQYIKDSSKSFIVEEIDSLTIKNILILMELFKNDLEFKKFLAHNLKEKIVKTPNLSSRELMNALVDTLEFEELRGEILRHALNSEVFYAFPISYIISLLKKMSIVTPFTLGNTHVAQSFLKKDEEDMRDLLKTLQIQLCMKQSELSIHTLKKLIIIHQTLPVLNLQFLHMLVSTFNMYREAYPRPVNVFHQHDRNSGGSQKQGKELHDIDL